MFQAQATNDLLGWCLITLFLIAFLLWRVLAAARRHEDRHKTMFKVFCSAQQAVKDNADKQREVATAILRKQPTPPVK